MSKTLIQLRIEKKKLLRLANKQFQEERIIRKAQDEKRKLKAQVRALKRRTSRTILAKTKRISKSLRSRATSPEAKRKLKGLKGELKRRFSKFQDFANKYG